MISAQSRQARSSGSETDFRLQITDYRLQNVVVTEHRLLVVVCIRYLLDFLSAGIEHLDRDD